jgi:hypothetical protein
VNHLQTWIIVAASAQVVVFHRDSLANY